MVKAIWAVACTVLVLAGALVLGGGCASTKSQMTDFSQMDVGGGPGPTLRRLTELQKDLGGQSVVANPEQKIPAVPPSGTLSSSDTPPLPVSDSAKAPETKTADSRNVNPPTDIARKTSAKEPGTKPQKAKSPSAASRPNSSNADSLSNKEKLPASEASRASSSPPRATTENAAPEATVFSEVPPAKSSDPASKQVSKSNFLSRLDDIVKKPTVTSRLDSPSEGTTKNIPVVDPKPVADMKTAESQPSPQDPSKSIPPSGIHETPEKGVSRQASAATIPPVAPLPSSNAGKAISSAGPQYRIGPEDVLHISVWGNEQLTMDAIVRPDGRISIPLVQDIQAEGLTASEMADLIHQKLLPYIKDPNVSVIVKQINAPKYSIIGYVNKPGTYPMRGDVTLLQALSEAGGFTPFASPRKIKLVRNASGKKEIRVFNYYDMIDKADQGSVLLKAGDTIVVP